MATDALPSSFRSDCCARGFACVAEKLQLQTYSKRMTSSTSAASAASASAALAKLASPSRTRKREEPTQNVLFGGADPSKRLRALNGSHFARGGFDPHRIDLFDDSDSKVISPVRPLLIKPPLTA